MRIHHVQLMMPRGEDEAALAFYAGLLGLERIPKPPDMPNPEGIWLTLGDTQLHLGVQEERPAATRAHVAFEVEALDALVAKLDEAGVRTEPSNPVDGLRRVHAWDPFGNRLELMGR